MLFNSHIFIFGFLPVALVGFFFLGRWTDSAAAAWLCICSLFFYGWWDIRFVPLLLLSIVFNFVVGFVLAKDMFAQPRAKRIFLTCGISGNLLLLAYFKYTNFFISNLDAMAGVHWAAQHIVLPLGISFFTFTQIAFLVDAYRGEVRETNPLHYLLFVTYFPHLIAGPVLHHKEMMSQFADRQIYRPRMAYMMVGLSIFFVGLFKKVILADGVAVYADAIFSSHGPNPIAAPSLLQAWSGALAYTLQIYFDFSGYSDMAVGLSRMFGVRLPINFNSPYKSRNIVEFWRRWHMTLSRFLRDYLYIPLGGNRKGKARRYLNLFLTMLLGGLWHGAGWTFVIWGALHGVYLILNHAWVAVSQRFSFLRSQLVDHLSYGVTFLSVVVAWVFFRAESITSSLAILRGMVGLNGVIFPEGWRTAFREHLGMRFAHLDGFGGKSAVLWMTSLLLGCWLLPNIYQIFSVFEPAIANVEVPRFRFQAGLLWAPTRRWAVLIAALGVAGVIGISKKSVFLYFQF